MNSNLLGGTAASAPFDTSYADVILRSSDGVDFRTHKVVLRLASSFFDDMFSLPQPATGAGEPEETQSGMGLPLIPVTEDSSTLDRLLRVCYPIADPLLDKVTDISAVLDAALKYQMDDAVTRLRTYLSSFVTTQPVSVYAIACRLGLEHEARKAAIQSLKLSEIEYVDEMDLVTAGVFHRLLQFRRMDETERKSFGTFCQPQSDMFESSPDASMQSTAHPFDHPSADVIVRSSDNVDFRVFKLILTLASEVLAQTMSLALETGVMSDDGLPLVILPEDSQTLYKILQFCYPMGDPDVEDLNNTLTHNVLQAATKYKLKRAVNFMKTKWVDELEARPLRAYFIAMRYEWDQEAREAASRLVYTSNDVYTSAMDDVPASTYRRLLDYRQRCRAVIYNMRSTFDFIPDGYQYHWSNFYYGRSEYSQFFLGNQGRISTTAQSSQTRAAILAIPLVARLINNRYWSSSLNDLFTESRDLEDALRDQFALIEPDLIQGVCVSGSNNGQM
ncbi:hypothetical protein AcW1_002045 [Taiwanofungus camphoratus]|nr:hypothetical protein AcW1_002045 [Antrodia cinnamomea]